MLVNNSGIPGQFLDVSNMDLADWNQVLAVNITGTMLCSREALERYAAPEVGEHHQYFIDGGEKGNPQAELLRHVKVGHARVHAHPWPMEVGPDNIRVNCICPGATEGDRIERVINAFVGSSERTYEEVRTRLESRASLRRMVTPEEVAQCAVFFASEDSSGMTGQIVDVSAGT